MVASQDEDFTTTNESFNTNVVATDIKCIGDRVTISQVVQLLAYIRNAIRNNRKLHIDVNVGSKIANGQFVFSVNDQEINDYIARSYIEIN